jgi:catechol 2,3-dioxygenase-like lactoylglutathione lyase family enzyme
MPELDAIGPVVTDLHRAVAFYRTLGVAVAEGAEESEHGHVEATLHSGMRLMLDTEAGILSFDPGWQRTSGSPGMALVIRCESPAAVDDIVQRPEHAGHGIHAVMVDARAQDHLRRPRRKRDRVRRSAALIEDAFRERNRPVCQEEQMKIKITGIYVEDQDKALAFYTEKLGFQKKADFSNSGYRWLTVVSPEEPDGSELLLEKNDNPAAKTFQQAKYQQGQPATQLYVDDIQAEYDRTKPLGVKFTMEPTKVTGSTIAMLDDTCGNLIQLVQLTGR